MAGFRPSDGGDQDELHEINVTPFIDVMLVLLIIFMVAAPLSTVDVPVDLPGVSAVQARRPPQDPVYLTLRLDLSLALDGASVEPMVLASALDARTAGRRETRIFLRADRHVDYGALMEVMGLLRQAGYLQVALVGLDVQSARASAP
jgi:biopolymer transport protein ExbD/biopolymer transport protein TolR